MPRKRHLWLRASTSVGRGIIVNSDRLRSPSEGRAELGRRNESNRARGANGLSKPPAGTVTFLLIDVEASSVASETQAAAIDAAIRHRDAVFREAANATSGFIVESGREGDGMLIAFAKASDAVSCALRVQLRLAAEGSFDDTNLSARVALNTGEAEFRDGNYFGQPINRCCRLLVAGHGGQILLSSATSDIIGGLLPEACTLLDLGLHRLRDIREPERVFQLAHPDLRAVFPSLRTTSGPATNLPLQVTRFVGRKRALAELNQTLPKSRLITLTGPGGSGKTRLAVELANQVAGDFIDGVWCVDLLPLIDPKLLAQSILAVLGLREEPRRDASETLIAHLKAKDALLLLDNCEHLVSAVAEFADRLLRGAPQLTLLVTSRSLLHLAGEVAWPVLPLELPREDASLVASDIQQSESVQLFVDRAVSSQPSFTLTTENIHAVAAICRQLDGLPLAIELAAARVSMMSPNQFISRLGDHLKLVSGRGYTADPKQRSLEAAFDWSYGLLEVREKTLFRRLGVFASPFTLEDAEAICGNAPLDPDQVLDLILALIDKSLVVVEHTDGGDVRYRLLETLRRYARKRLADKGELTAMNERLAKFCSSVAANTVRRLHSPDGPTLIEVLAEQNDNLRAALSWYRDRRPRAGLQLATGLVDYWDLRGLLTEGRRWLADLLQRHPSRDALRANALAGAGLLAFRQGDNIRSRDLYEESLDIGHAIADRRVIARALRGISDALLNLGDYRHSEAGYRQSLEAFRRCGDVAETALALSRLGNVVLIRGDVASSIKIYEESRTLYYKLGDPFGIANQLWSVGSAEVIGGDYAASCSHFEECLAIRQGIHDELGVPYAQMMLAYAYIQLGRFAEARSLYRSCIPKVWAMGDLWALVGAFDHMVGLPFGEGKLRDAFWLAGAAAAVRDSTRAQQLPWIGIVVEGWLSSARTRLGDESAERAYREGRAMSVGVAVDRVLGFLAGTPASPSTTGIEHRVLSRRELQVAHLVSDGMSNREIGRALFIGERTVDNHVQHILQKLGFRSRAQVGAWLLRNNTQEAVTAKVRSQQPITTKK